MGPSHYSRQGIGVNQFEVPLSACGLNRSMQHLISNYREEDVESTKNSRLMLECQHVADSSLSRR